MTRAPRLVRSLLAAALLLALSGSLPAAPPERYEHQEGRLYASPPRVTGFYEDRAVVEFETVREAPAARVLYGFDPVAPGGTGIPLFRKVAEEAGREDARTWSEHRVEVDVSRLEHRLYAPGLLEGGGGTVVFQVQAWDSETRQVLMREGRFGYRRRGVPGRGEYRLVPCLEEGPHLDQVTHRSAVISWRTPGPSQGRVELWCGGGSPCRTVHAPGSQRGHEVRLTGLEPATTYSYRVHPGGEGHPSGRFTFRTAPRPGDRSPFRWAFLSDGRNAVDPGRTNLTGVNAAVIARLLGDARRRGAAVAVFGGDLVDGYTSSQEHFVAQLASYRRAKGAVSGEIPVYEAMGNHEQFGAYFLLPDPEDPARRFGAFRALPDPHSASALFSRELVNPAGSAYTHRSPAPEERVPGPRADRRHFQARGPAYGETVYSFQHANCLFVVLNSNYWATGLKRVAGALREGADHVGTDRALQVLGGNREGYLMSHQLRWLRRELRMAEADSRVDHVFVVLHEPPFPCGGHIQDAMFWRPEGTREPGLNDRSQPLGDVTAMRDRFMKTLLGSPKVVAVLTGDEHNYSRLLVGPEVVPSYPGRIWQLVSGGAGAPYYLQDHTAPWSESVQAFSGDFHYCLLEVDGPRVSLEVVSETGEVLDRVEDLTAVRRPGESAGR